jgi:SAM-dependent methyltransferase
MDGRRRNTEEDQAALWNGPAGQAWVDAQDMLDRLLMPFERLLADAVSARGPRHLIDVGCGTGSTTLAMARLLDGKGRCVGVDISEPMIRFARARAERCGSSASFVCADAQSLDFEPASADMIVSRFGVMFFDDPVRAFANLRRAALNGAELRFVVFRSPAENPFMTTAERAAAPYLPELPPRRPDAPGQFAFADRERVHSILEQSGWDGIDIRPIDVACSLPEPELLPYLSRLGPVGRALQQVDDGTREHVLRTVRAAFDPYIHGSEVRFDSACWMASAKAGAR